ncbi:MAG: DMT family transporter [Candidatus Sericytochromatia bacterium]|nr:DMT family transporter [Candidatus Sericytochromatia bacterium]
MPVRDSGHLQERFAWVFLLVASLAFGASGPMARLATPASPFEAAFFRLVIAAFATGLACHRTLWPALRDLPRHEALRVLAAGAILGLHFSAFLWGLAHTSLPAAVSLVSLEPMAVLLVCGVVYKHLPTRTETVGLILATLGALVVAQGAGHGEHRLEGDLGILLAVVLFGGYVALLRPVRHLGVLASASVIYASAALTVGTGLGLMHLIGHGGPQLWRLDLPWSSWAAMAGLGLVPTVLGHTLVQAASRSLRPAIVSLASPGETVAGIALGILLMGLWPEPVEAIGTVLIVAGMAWPLAAGMLGDVPALSARRR